MRKTIKLAVTALAFVPALVAILNFWRILPKSAIVNAAVIFNLPAVSLTHSLMTPDTDARVVFGILLLTMFLWSALIAVVFRKVAGMFLGEDEVEGRKFDWVAFQVRFAFGFVIGFLAGWRLAINSGKTTILISMIASGIFGGLLLGSWRENFWSRPL